MTASQITKLIEDYENLEKLRNLERGKRFCDQFVLDQCEDRMAAIETRFQKAGDDLSAYL